MANLDELYIQIESDSSRAENAINSLVNSLNRLNDHLGLKNGSQLTQILNTLAKSSNQFTNTINGISSSGFEQVTKGAEKASESMRKSTEQVEKFKATYSQLSNAQINDGLFKAFEKDVGQTNQKNLMPSQPLGLPMFDKMLPAVVQAQDATRGLFQSIEEVVNEQPKVDAVTGSFNEWKSSLLEAAKAAEQTGAQFEKWSVPEQGMKPSFNREALGFVSDIKPTVGEDYFYKIQESAQKCLPAIREVGTTALALPDQFKSFEQATKQAFDSIKSSAKNTVESFSDFHFPDLGTGIPEETFKGVEQGARHASSAIKEALENMRKFKEIISGMESGKVPFFEEGYRDALKGYNEAAKKVDDFKKSISGGGEKPTAMSDVLENVVELGNALGELSEKFGGIADKGINLFKMLTKPLQMATHEYTEKFENMGKTVANFQKNFKAHMAKIQQFWKRTMKTFTFMLVRKAITAIIKEVNNAIQSMAKFSDAMGTQFNNSISVLVADFQYLGRSIVSVFAPLINFIAPIIDAIVDKIALLLSYIGMLMAALTGASSFTKAKKNVGNYAKSLDGASKSAKNLTMGIDELNILAENSGGGSAKPYDGWEDAWEEVDIPSWLKDMADWFKDLWDRFTAPLKEAWARAKQYVIDGFKTMLLALQRMFGHIIDDFLTMWNQEATIRMFEQIFKIVGDLFRVIRNLANQFDLAWEKGKVGLRIFENIRDILKIIIDHVRNVSYYMIGWADNIDFYPMLEAFEQLTGRLKRVADFIGGVFEDVMINGVLKYINFIIEDAIPHLYETITKIVDAFNFPTLREKLQPVWSAFEEMLENIHTGTTNALGNLGEALARFVNSQEFYNFLARIADITKVITSERVEKVLTGLGQGILNIAEAVVKFVNSDAFMAFLEGIGKWIDKKSTGDIAKVLENISKVIIGFKFAEFTTSKLSGFFKFFTIITAVKNLATIAKHMTGVADGVTKLGKAAPAVGALYNPFSKLSSITGTLSGKIASLTETFKIMKSVGIKDSLSSISASINGFAAGLPTIVTLLGSVATGFLEFKGAEKSASDLTRALNGDDDYSVGGSLLGLVGKIGVATAAFTAFLGVPGGVIAGLAVGAIGAIKGIQDTIDQINFEQVTGAILTQGDMTIGQVKQWYSEATSTVREHTEYWKNAERSLTEGRTDIQEYARSLEGLESAFSSSLTATAGMANQLTGIYSDMSASIDNYIDESTTALVNNLLAQRDYLESQGYNVDEMIANLLINADKEKQAVDEATTAAQEASKAYQDAIDKYGEGSAEAIAAYDDLIAKTGEYRQAIERYVQTTNEIDTSEAVRQIQELGKSLDLSQYANWDEAADAIKSSLQEIQTAFDTELTGVNETVESKMEEVAQQFREGRITEEDYRIQVQSITQAWTEDTNTLIDATGQSLDLYNQSLVTGLQGVAQTADAEWESTNPFVRFFTMGHDKDAYIYGQMQTYVNDMLGDSGLTGEMQRALELLPGNVQPYSLESMTRLVNDAADAYIQGTYDNEDYTSQGASGSWQNVVNSAIGMLDLQPIYEMGESTVTSYNSGIEENTEVSKTTVQTWMNNIPQWIHDSDMKFGSPSQTMIDFGMDTVLGYNQGIDENADSTQSSIAGWFMKVQAAVSTQVSQVKALVTKLMADVFNFGNIDVVTPITTLFTNVTTAITNNINLLGANLTGTILPTFMQTYLLPFFGLERWQPLFDNLMNTVFIPLFEIFRTWFTEEAMTVWWNEDLLFWFSADKWNEDIFTPLHELFQENWDTFSGWWDTSMTAWWENQVKVWFSEEIWEEQFNHVLTVAEKVFELIKDAIKKRIEEAQKAVETACDEMKKAIEELLELIDEMLEKIGGLGSIGGNVEITFTGKGFANGGFPTEGSLFLAGEAGAEFVTNVGGRTGVVSNGEITGIADAVYSTGNQESTLLSELISVGRQMLDKDPVVIGDKDIARMANSGQSKLGMSIIS